MKPCMTMKVNKHAGTCISSSGCGVSRRANIKRCRCQGSCCQFNAFGKGAMGRRFNFRTSPHLS